MSIFLWVAGTILSLFMGFSAQDHWYQAYCYGAATMGVIWIGVWLVSNGHFKAWQIAIAAFGVYIAYAKPPSILSVPVPENPIRKPWRPFREGVEDFREGETGPKGEEPICDLPLSLRMKNTGGMGPGGPGTGSGLCVFTSINHSAFFQQCEALFNFQKQMTREPGGGYPEKVDAMIAKYAPGTQYVQHTGGDEDFLKLALKTGRMPGVTYAGRDNRYGGPIAHMVNLIYLDENSACILDNNFPTKPLWMTRKEFLDRWRDRGGGWAVVLLNSPPPPPPSN